MLTEFRCCCLSSISICQLYKWRYKCLGDLQHIVEWPEYKKANPGFAYDFQLVNVGEFNDVGETEPNPYFYQNLAEAEYVVAVYMYMRLLGYPAEKISILTTYNGQKHLLRDVINARCGENPLIGRPHKVTTVDKYQGQQNDYILVSLVRTKAVGHLRDVRRLVVALSRARLGLYIFGRVNMFQNCYELQKAFKILLERPTELRLVPGEVYGACERQVAEAVPEERCETMRTMTGMADFVYKYYMKKVDDMKMKMEAMQDLYAKKPRPEKDGGGEGDKDGSGGEIGEAEGGSDADEESVAGVLMDADGTVYKVMERTARVEPKEKVAEEEEEEDKTQKKFVATPIVNEVSEAVDAE